MRDNWEQYFWIGEFLIVKITYFHCISLASDQDLDFIPSLLLSTYVKRKKKYSWMTFIIYDIIWRQEKDIGEHLMVKSSAQRLMQIQNIYAYFSILL